MKATAAIVIPARYAATRLPGKPLVTIGNKPLIQWVYERATQVPNVAEVLVATDDSRIVETVQQVGGKAILTPADFSSGTERVAFVARQLSYEIIVNLQGDEPLVDVQGVEQAIAWLSEHPDVPVATLGCPLQQESQWQNPHVVKVITDQRHRALFFTRQAVPFYRDDAFHPIPGVFQHVGVYVFRRDFLQTYVTLPPAPMEQVEKLEQWRILWHGYPLQVIPIARCEPGVDTPEDVQRMEALLTAK